MAYMTPTVQRSSLISRRGYSGVGMGDFWDTISGAAGGVLSFWGKQQQAIGAQQQAAQQNKDLIAAMNAQNGGGISTETILIGAAALGAAFLIFRKKG
jgi:hypothetical protein